MVLFRPVGWLTSQLPLQAAVLVKLYGYGRIVPRTSGAYAFASSEHIQGVCVFDVLS
jgi:hypothetical protein